MSSMESQKKPNHFASFSKTATAPIVRESALQNITNYSSTFRRSTISTSKSKIQSRNSILQKSRIKELPHYEKYSMGNNLPFVVIFQAIEIQRLSEEIELQRIKLKQSDRLRFNSSNFQVQIKQLSERCTSGQDELTQYRVQLQKMNKICETLYHENQSLKSKLKNTDWVFKTQLQQETAKSKQLSQELDLTMKKMQQIQKRKQMEIQQIKSLIEKQRKSMLNREVKQMEIRHQAQIAQLMIEIRRVSELVESKQAIIHDLNIKNKNSDDYMNEIKGYGAKISQYENKIRQLSQEHLRLSQIIGVNANELENARKIQFKLKQQMKTDKDLQIDLERLAGLLKVKQQQQQIQRLKIKEMEQKILKSKEFQHTISQLSNKMGYLDQENRKLMVLLKERADQIDKLKSKIIQFQKQNDKLKQDEAVVLETDRKYKLLLVENEKLQGLSNMKTKQIEQLKNRCATAETQLSYFNRMEKQKQSLESKYKGQAERITDLQRYVQKIQQQFQSLKQTSDMQRSSSSTIEGLRKQIERLNTRIGEYDKQLNDLKQFEKELGRQYVKIKQTEISLSEYQGKVKIMTNEIERLEDMLRLKNQQIIRVEDQNIKCVGVVNQCKSLQAELKQKDELINKIRKQLETTKNKMTSFQQNIQKNECQNQQLVSNLNQQIQKLQQELKKKTKQCDDIKSKQTKLNNQIQQMDQLHKMNQKQQNRITVYLKDIEDLRNSNKQYEEVIQIQRKKTQEINRQARRQFGQSASSMMDSCRSAQSGKSRVSEADPHKLVLKIERLQITLKDLKVKYQDLLKQVQTRSSTKRNSNSNSNTLSNNHANNHNQADHVITNGREFKLGHSRSNTNNSGGFISSLGSNSMIHEVQQSAFMSEDSQ